MVGSRPRDGLHAHGAAFFEGGRVGPKNQLRGRCNVLGQTSDRQIFVIQGVVIQEYLRRLVTNKKMACRIVSTRNARVSPLAVEEGSRTARVNHYLFHDREHPGLVVVVAVGPNAQVHLVGKRVCLVGRGELEDATLPQSVPSRRQGGSQCESNLSGGASGTDCQVSTAID